MFSDVRKLRGDGVPTRWKIFEIRQPMPVEFILMEMEVFEINLSGSKCNITFARGGKFYMNNLVEFCLYELVGKTNNPSISGIHTDRSSGSNK